MLLPLLLKSTAASPAVMLLLLLLLPPLPVTLLSNFCVCSVAVGLAVLFWWW